MKQDLEKILKENRLKLDVEEPEIDLIWEGVRSNMQGKQKQFPQWFWKVAAIVLFVVSAGYFTANQFKQPQVVLLTLADVSAELGNEEKQLQQAVQVKWDEVQSLLPKSNPQMKELLDEMKTLDQVYSTYQQDLSVSVSNEQTIRAMLDYYNKKIQLLNRMVMEIEKGKKLEDDRFTEI